MLLSQFYPLIAKWFQQQVGCSTHSQVCVWSAIQSGATSHDIKLSVSDPLNLAGIILPGSRVPAVPSNFVVFCDGAVVRAWLAGWPRTDRMSRLSGVNGLGRNSEQGAARATDHPFGGASSKQIEEAGMSFRHHHDQVHIEIRSCR